MMTKADQKSLSAGQTLLMRAFGRPAGLLGRLGGMLMARLNRRMVQRVVEVLQVQPADRLLEVGFGPGVGIGLLARAVPSGWVAGIDPSPEMVQQASARNAGAIAGGRVTLRRGFVEDLPFEAAMFDKALTINSMQVWSDPTAGLHEVHRVLKPGGQLALGFTRWAGRAREGLTETLTATGFANPRMVDVGPRGDFCTIAIKS